MWEYSLCRISIARCTMEEEEPECQYPKITEACKPQCTTSFAAYEVSRRRRVKRNLRRGFGACWQKNWPVFFFYVQINDKCWIYYLVFCEFYILSPSMSRHAKSVSRINLGKTVSLGILIILSALTSVAFHRSESIWNKEGTTTKKVLLTSQKSKDALFWTPFY